MNLHKPYEELLGFVPELTEIRHAFTSEFNTEMLDIHEEFRKKTFSSAHLDHKTMNVILFAILSSHMKEGAKVHAKGALKHGATYEELHAVANLVFLFAGLSCMNFAIRLLSEIHVEEQNVSA